MHILSQSFAILVDAKKHVSAAAFVSATRPLFNSSIVPEVLGNKRMNNKLFPDTDFDGQLPCLQFFDSQEDQFAPKPAPNPEHMLNPWHMLFIHSDTTQFSPVMVIPKDSLETRFHREILTPLLSNTMYFKCSLQTVIVRYARSEFPTSILRDLSSVRSLTKVEFDREIQPHQLPVLTKLSNLESLSLTGSIRGPSEEDIADFVDKKNTFPRLRELIAQCMSDVGTFVKSCPNLQKLTIRQTQNVDLGDVYKHVPGLTHLEITGIMHSTNITSFACLRDFELLQFLKFGQCNGIDPELVSDFEQYFNSRRSLVKISLFKAPRNNSMERTSSSSLRKRNDHTTAALFPQLQELDLGFSSDDPIPENIIRVLSNSCPSLRTFDFKSSPEITAADLMSKYFTAETRFVALHTLDLSECPKLGQNDHDEKVVKNNKINDDAHFRSPLARLFAGPYFPCLRRLSIRDSNLTDDDLAGFQCSPLSKTLVDLDFCGNTQVTERGLSFLSGLKKLSSLTLDRIAHPTNLDFIENMNELKTLYVGVCNNFRSPDCLKVFSKNLNAFPDLHMIRFSDEVDTIPAQALAHLAANNNLRQKLSTLFLIDKPLRYSVIEQIVKLKGLKRIQRPYRAEEKLEFYPEVDEHGVQHRTAQEAYDLFCAHCPTPDRSVLYV